MHPVGTAVKGYGNKTCPVCSEPTDTLPHPPCTDGRDDERQPY